MAQVVHVLTVPNTKMEVHVFQDTNRYYSCRVVDGNILMAEFKLSAREFADAPRKMMMDAGKLREEALTELFRRLLYEKFEHAMESKA